MHIINTPRLQLRPCRPDDAIDIYDMLAEPDTAWWADLPQFEDEEEAESFILWGLFSGDVCQFSIVDRESGQFFGLVQAKSPRLSGEAPDTVELGYLLCAAARGNGYMTEAVCALRDSLFGEPSIGKLTLEILPTNRGSLGVATRCGFVYEDQAPEQKERRFLDDSLLDRYVLTRKRYEEEISKAA
ncbi:MAG: GNAT family N-acetyltransferase [Bacteroidales bacterium]|nr:GNAT family N-acetyltransferase [Bacteroidales bacterium]